MEIIEHEKPLLIPAKRTGRLKSEIFVENLCDTLPDGEYDICREDFDSPVQTPKKKIKLSDSLDSGQDEGMHGGTLNKEELLSAYNDVKKSKKQKKKSKNYNLEDLNEIEFESIDTSAIVEMLKDTTGLSNDGTEAEDRRTKSKSDKQLKQTKIVDLLPNNSGNIYKFITTNEDNGVMSNSTPKKGSQKANVDKINFSNVENNVCGEEMNTAQHIITRRKSNAVSSLEPETTAKSSPANDDNNLAKSNSPKSNAKKLNDSKVENTATLKEIHTTQRIITRKKSIAVSSLELEKSHDDSQPQTTNDVNVAAAQADEGDVQLNDTNVENSTAQDEINISQRVKARRKSIAVSKEKAKKTSQSSPKSKDVRERPKKSPNPKVVKVNVLKALNMRSYASGKTLTKEHVQKGKKRKIPKNRLDDILQMIDHDDHPLWEDHNISCTRTIDQYWNARAVPMLNQNMNLKYARQFLLRRDWISLSKILCLSHGDCKAYYPLLSKYACLLLAHTDKEHFDKFVHLLVAIDASSVVLKKCTSIPKRNQE